MGHVAIRSTGSHTPGWRLTNEELIERFGLEVDAAWIESRTGIESRHWLEPGRTTSDMAVEAARDCLAGDRPEARNEAQGAREMLAEAAAETRAVE